MKKKSTKESKLKEKASRMPDIRESKLEKLVTQYLREIEELNSESARSHRFGVLLNDLIGIEPGFIESYVSGIEKYIKVKQKDRILRGRTDNLFGNLIIELEGNISKKRLEAEEQLRRYVSILWSQDSPDSRIPYLCIASDGVRFITYTPILAAPTREEISPEDIVLDVLEEADWTKLQPHEAFYWLDRYFLRKEVLHPTSEQIVKDFGIKSHALKTSTESLSKLWQTIKEQNAFSVVYDSWEKYLRIVYGSEIGDEELFIHHTYLATLAKLMCWMRITESLTLPDDEQILEMLEGKLFKKQGIENFIEEDFFSWLSREGAEKVGVSVVRWLFSLLQNYNLRELSEDVLKSLYQELVDPATRHDLGEFYTPDWLAHKMVNKLLDENPESSVLDPACGSGTFLYLTIKEKRERLGNSLKTLQHILDSVYGADIHPLAVNIAKTNYILALGDLLKKRKGKITIPVYLADTIKLPELETQTKNIVINGTHVAQLPGYKAELDGNEIHLPEILLNDLSLYDQAIEIAKEFAHQYKGKNITLKTFKNYLKAQHFHKTDDDEILMHSIYSIAEILKSFIESDRDTIWAFILKNIYKPLFFKRSFDFITGNPPWIAFRYMESGYQNFLKQQITKNYKLLGKRGELITHLEVATLFLIRTADLYLKQGGTIAFVLPRSLFNADQHYSMRIYDFILCESENEFLEWKEVWDCENIYPLFNVPSCVFIAEKVLIKPSFRIPIPAKILKGKLSRKNASLSETENELEEERAQFHLHERGKKRSFWAVGKTTKSYEGSYYKSLFSQGGSIVPRSFWFVQVKSSKLGFNPDLPLLVTQPRTIKKAKKPYDDVHFEGNVESSFLYSTLLSTDLLPFGHLRLRSVVLPILPKENGYEMLTSEKALQKGFVYLSNWLHKVEREWIKRRGAKARKMSAIEWLDYRHKISNQQPKTKYHVVYNTSGTFLTASVVSSEDLKFEIQGQSLLSRGFIADTKTYYMELNDIDEAFYLTAVLNAPLIDKLLKPMQSRGLFGPRDIHKKVLELPIPKFDPNSPDHKKLVELGGQCSRKVEKWVNKGGPGKIKSIGKLRGMVREMLKKELGEIDSIVSGIVSVV